MVSIQYDPLYIEDDLFLDVQTLLREGGVDRKAAAFDLALLCEGDPARGLPPAFERAATTIGRVEGDGEPPPSVSMFPWGGHFPGLKRIRVWFLRQGNSSPIGLGAFSAERDDEISEEAAVMERVMKRFGPACYLKRG